MPPPFERVPLCKTHWYWLYQNTTKHEDIVEAWLAEWGPEFGRYRVQHPLCGGKWIADFALPDLKILLEVDGESHTRKGNRIKDAIRDAALAKAGWTTVRVSNSEVASIGAKLRLRSRLAETALRVREQAARPTTGRKGARSTSTEPGPTEEPNPRTP